MAIADGPQSDETIPKMSDWEGKQRILVILAHPDDPEFFCGGMIAKWVNDGHRVDYLLMTKGEKGINDHFDDVNGIIAIREVEQRNAADVLGVCEIRYLDYLDGSIYPDLPARQKVTAAIRDHKPDIIVTCDPTNYYMNDNYINHPDHRAAGQIVVDAVFPGVQNKLYFPELIEQGYEPHHVREIWISLPKDPNTIIDVTNEWPKKMAALECHRSQIGELETFREHMQQRGFDRDGEIHFEEKFHRIIFR